MDGQSLNIKQTDTARLRELCPGIFSEDKIDPEKFKAAFGDDIDAAPPNERYTLNWAGKADAYRILQERTAATLKPQPELSVNFDTAENVFIEGENLEVLKILQKSYYNKVKCIIIDPPYNTGNDSFIYPDRFKENLEEYEKRVGERDEGGYLMKEGLFRKNSKENGHYHSNWLSMMLPRLFLARNLMRDDGVIFVHIDDNEVHNLRMVMNEVFGEDNFVGQWNWFKSATPPNLSKKIKKNIEYILCYQRGNNNGYFKGIRKTSSSDDPMTKPQNTVKTLIFPPESISTKLKDGVYKVGIYGTEKFPNELLSDMVIEKGTNQNEAIFKNKFVWLQSKLDEELLNGTRISLSTNLVLSYKKAEYGEEVPPNLIDETVGVDTTENAGRYLTELFNGKTVFDYPKPVSLLKYLINFLVDNGDLILDFFAGSATVAQAVLELNQEDNGNRKFILVQLPELCDKDSKAHKSGYKTIADISRERIRRVIRNLDGNADNSCLGFKSYKLSPSNFKVWRSEEITEENIERQLEAFIDPVKPESQVEDMLVELILKSGYKLTEKVENFGDFYYINNELVVALTKINQEIAAKIMNLSPKPQKAIVLDRLFEGSDELKTNTALQMRDAGVEFRTI